MIAIIPARGGSKGLPGKNIKLLNGKPLIAYTIEAAKQSENVSRVIVNTDDAEISKVALDYGAEVPFVRPSELASDTAKSIDVLLHTLAWLKKNEDLQIDEIIVLQPTSPLRTTQHIDEAIKMYLEKKADSVISYCQEEHSVFWHKFITDEGKFEDIFNGDYLKNRQEIRPTFYPNGAIYIIKTKLLLEKKYYSENAYAFLMDKKSSVDIDTMEDFEFAEWLYKKDI